MYDYNPWSVWYSDYYDLLFLISTRPNRKRPAGWIDLRHQIIKGVMTRYFFIDTPMEYIGEL